MRDGEEISAPEINGRPGTCVRVYAGENARISDGEGVQRCIPYKNVWAVHFCTGRNVAPGCVRVRVRVCAYVFESAECSLDELGRKGCALHSLVSWRPL